MAKQNSEITVKGYKYVDKDTYQFTTRFESMQDFFDSLKEKFEGKRLSVKHDDSILLVSDNESDEIVLIKNDNKVLFSNGDYTNGKRFKAVLADELLKQLER